MCPAGGEGAKRKNRGPSTKRVMSQRTCGAGVEKAGSAHGFVMSFQSHEACSVTGPEEQRQVRSGVRPHRAQRRERWSLPEVIREGIKEEAVFGP